MDQEKIKPIAYAVAGLIILALVASVSWSPLRNLFSKKIKPPSASQSSLKSSLADENKSEEQKLQERVSVIIASRDLNRCNEIKDETYRKVCVNNIALNLAQEKQDASYCQKVDGSLISLSQCESEVIPEKALNEKDIKVCDEATSSEITSVCQKDFWSRLAAKEENIKECDNLTAGAERNRCYDMYFLAAEFITGKSTDCNQFASEQAKKDCELYKVIFENNKIQDCPKLKTDFFQLLCRAMR